MQVTLYKDRKPTDQKFTVETIDDTSVASLVASLGEDRVKGYVTSGLRAAFASAYASQVKEGKTPQQIAAWAKTWKPTRGQRTSKTPEQRVLDVANKLGVSVDTLQKILASQKKAA